MFWYIKITRIVSTMSRTSVRLFFLVLKFRCRNTKLGPISRKTSAELLIKRGHVPQDLCSQNKACQACVNSQLLGIFFKTKVTQSVAELILYSKKTRNCGHFLSNLANQDVKM